MNIMGKKRTFQTSMESVQFSSVDKILHIDNTCAIHVQKPNCSKQNLHAHREKRNNIAHPTHVKCLFSLRVDSNAVNFYGINCVPDKKQKVPVVRKIAIEKPMVAFGMYECIKCANELKF